MHSLQAAAAVQLEGLKEMSALGLEHAIQKHSVLDIQVTIHSTIYIRYNEQNLISIKIHKYITG